MGSRGGVQAKAADGTEAKKTITKAVVATARGIDDARARVRAFGCIADKQAETRDFVGALVTAESIQDHAKRAETLIAIVRILAKNR